MFLAFGSLVLPIKAALMTALTLGATIGILTWMFVDGHGAGLMNYTPEPMMSPMIGADHRHHLRSVDRLRGVPGVPHGGGAGPWTPTTESIRVGTATPVESSPPPR